MAERDEDELERRFAEARARPPAVDATFLARLMADAARVSAEAGGAPLPAGASVPRDPLPQGRVAGGAPSSAAAMAARDPLSQGGGAGAVSGPRPAARPPGPRRRGAGARLWAGLGGWPGVSGLLAATVAGLWIGFALPESVRGLAAPAGSEETLDLLAAADGYFEDS